MAIMTIQEVAQGVGVPAATAEVLLPRVNASVTAAGTNLATATALKSQINVVTTVASSTGVALPLYTPVGRTIVVQNLGANDLEVFPATSSEIINGASAGGAITLAAATDVIGYFTKVSSTRWVGFVVAGPAT